MNKKMMFTDKLFRINIAIFNIQYYNIICQFLFHGRKAQTVFFCKTYSDNQLFLHCSKQISPIVKSYYFSSDFLGCHTSWVQSLTVVDASHLVTNACK